MKPRIKYIHSPDVHDLATYQPEVIDDFGILFQIIAGPDGAPGEESFDLVVCSPKWITRVVETQKILIGRHHLIVEGYDYIRIRAFLEKQCEDITGDSWEEIAAKLGQIGKWEFEDYRK